MVERSVAEFFAGIGLMRLGLEGAGWETRFAHDISAEKETLYTANFGAGDFLRGDVHQLDSRLVPSVTLATASFPCTDLSLAGGRAGLGGKESSAFWGFVRVLEDLSRESRLPPLVLLENVTGFLTSRGGQDFRDALLALSRLGYAVDALILDAAWFVPQSRQRLFVIGVQRDFLLKTSSSLPLASRVRPKALVDFILGNPDLGWNLTPIAGPETVVSTLADVLEDLPDDHPDWWSRERVAYFENQTSERHRAQLSQFRSQEGWSYATAFRRTRQGRLMAELRTDGLAGCLRTPKGGSARQILVRMGDGRLDVRLLTGRECARLMGAPDSFKLDVPLNQALFAFGDAVCVPVVMWLARNCLNPHLGEPYPDAFP